LQIFCKDLPGSIVLEVEAVNGFTGTPAKGIIMKRSRKNITTLAIVALAIALLLPGAVFAAYNVIPGKGGYEAVSGLPVKTHGVNYVDANGDGICDYAPLGGCCSYADADGDGVCDHYSNYGCYGHGQGTGQGGGFIDSNGDGVCDNYNTFGPIGNAGSGNNNSGNVSTGPGYGNGRGCGMGTGNCWMR
jgi:hypothetical protein